MTDNSKITKNKASASTFTRTKLTRDNSLVVNSTVKGS